jgi:hypothetical protein
MGAMFRSLSWPVLPARWVSIRSVCLYEARPPPDYQQLHKLYEFDKLDNFKNSVLSILMLNISVFVVEPFVCSPGASSFMQI